MVVAKLYPEPKRGMHSEFQNETEAFSKAHLSRARTVLGYAQTDRCYHVGAVSQCFDPVVRVWYVGT